MFIEDCMYSNIKYRRHNLYTEDGNRNNSNNFIPLLPKQEANKSKEITKFSTKQFGYTDGSKITGEYPVSSSEKKNSGKRKPKEGLHLEKLIQKEINTKNNNSVGKQKKIQIETSNVSCISNTSEICTNTKTRKMSEKNSEGKPQNPFATPPIPL